MSAPLLEPTTAPPRRVTSVTRTASGERGTDERGLLDLQQQAGNSSVQRALGVQRKAKGGGGGHGTKYDGPRLEVKLRELIAQKKLAPLTDEQIYILQGMANVESSGKTACVNTWDNMFVSMGFKQVTLAW